jgi:hypothetical protein
LSGVFKTEAGALGDPTTVKLLVRLADVETIYTYGVGPEVQRVSAGSYRFEFVPTSGNWTYRWLGVSTDGLPRGAAESRFVVSATEFTQ